VQRSKDATRASELQADDHDEATLELAAAALWLVLGQSLKLRHSAGHTTCAGSTDSEVALNWTEDCDRVESCRPGGSPPPATAPPERRLYLLE